MKKIKWLTPLMGLTAISGCLVPLTTSCSSNADKIVPTNMLNIVGNTLVGFKDNVDFSKYNTVSIPSTVKIVGENSLNNIGNTITKVVFSKENRTFQQNVFKNNTSVKTLDFSSWTIEEVYYSKFDSNAFSGLSKSGKVVFNKDLKTETKESFVDKLLAAGLSPAWLVEETTGNITCEQKTISTTASSVNFSLKLAKALASGNVLKAYVSVTGGSEGASATVGEITIDGTNVTMLITLTGLSKTDDNVSFDITFACYENETSKLPAWVETLNSFKVVYSGEPISKVVVTFKPNNGSADFTKEVIKGGKVTLPELPTKIGYIFGGWYTDEALTKSFNFESSTISENITLYGYWMDEQTTQINAEIDPITQEVTIVADEMTSFTETTLQIPAYISNHPVTSIGDSAFKGNQNITKAILPSTLKTIGTNAFYNCNSLKSINSEVEGEFIMPDNLQTIGDNSFNSIHSICKLSLPNSITKIGGGAFINDNSLVYLNSSTEFEAILPNNITEIGEDAFYNTTLRVIHLPRNLVKIGKDAFHYAIVTNLKYEDNAYYLPCNSLEGESSDEIEADKYFALCKIDNDTNTTLNVHDNCKIFASSYSSNPNTNITTITLPTSLISFLEPFAYAVNLNAIYTRDESTLENGVFKFGSNLKYLPPKIGEYESFYCQANKIDLGSCSNLFEIPEGCFEYKGGDSSFANELILPPNVESIGDNAFKGCHFTTFDIPKSLKHMGGGALPETVTTINISSENENFTIDNDMLFSTETTLLGAIKTLVFVKNLSSKTVVTLPSDLSYIGSNAFNGASSLTSITLPSGLLGIGDFTFANCPNLSSINFPSSLLNIGFGCLLGSITNITNNPFEDTESSWTIIDSLGSTISESYHPYSWDETTKEYLTAGGTGESYTKWIKNIE